MPWAPSWVLCLCLGLASASTFKIGVVTPQTTTGDNFFRGLEWWRDKVNAVGGVRSKDGITMQVELVMVYSGSTPESAAQKVLDFYNGSPTAVHALVNAFQQFNLAINDAMRANNVQKVLMHCSGGTPGMYGIVDLNVPRWGFQFGVMVPSADYASGVFKHIMTFNNRLPNKRVAFFRNTGNSFTDFTCGESIARATAEGLEVSEIFQYDLSASSDSYASVMLAGVRALQASGTQILMGCTWLDDGLALQKAIVAERLDLIASIILIAPTTGHWNVTFPRDSLGRSDGDFVLAPSQWHHTQSFLDYSSVGNTADFAEEFKNATGSDPDYLLASCTTAGIILERALSKVTLGNYSEPSTASGTCSCDVGFDEQLRLMVRDFEEETMYGRVRFDRFNQNVGHEAAVVQVLPNMGQTSVLPEENAQSRLNFPTPPWDERLACPPNCTDPNIFKIGVVGPAAGPGPNFRRGLEWWAKKVNDAGGMRTLNGERLTVELSFEDSEENNTLAAAKVIQYYYRLSDNVQAMVNTYFMHNIEVNEAMRMNQVDKLLLHCSGGEPEQYGYTQGDGQQKPRWIYQFGVMIPSSTYGEGVFNFLSKKLANADDEVLRQIVSSENGRRVAFFRNVGNSFANYTCNEAIYQAQQAGLEVNVSTDVFDFDSRDPNYAATLWESIRNVKSRGISMSMGCTWIEDGIELQRAIVSERVELALNVILVAPATEQWFSAFPADDNGRSDGDYVLSPSQWHHTQNYRDESSVGDTSTFSQEFKAETGGDPDYLLASCVTAGIVIEKAMSSVNWFGRNQFDDNALRIATRDLRVDTMYGGVRFDNVNQNVGHDATVIQIQPGSTAGQTFQTSVLPETNSARNIIFPAPTWEWRNGCPPTRPISSNGFSCVEQVPDDFTLYYIIAICAAVPLLSLLALYFGRWTHSVLRRRREKYMLLWLNKLEDALWDQDEDSVRMAEGKLRSYRGTLCIRGKYVYTDTDDIRKEQSLQAGVGVAYLIGDFMASAFKATRVQDPTFHDLKHIFFLGEKKIGADKICPRDGKLGCAFVDTLPRQHRQKCTHFLSWSWAYTVRQVRSGLDFWIESSGLDPGKTFLFMCFFVNNQYRLLVGKDQHGADDLNLIFEGNLCRIGKMVALLDNWQEPVYLKRIWTIFEQYVAVTKDIEVKIILPRDAEANLFMTISRGAEGIRLVKESLCAVDSATADAWSPEDKEAIQSLIQRTCGFHTLNQHVRQVMINWVGDVVIGAMNRLINKGEDIAASANQWAGKAEFEGMRAPSRETTWSHML